MYTLTPIVKLITLLLHLSDKTISQHIEHKHLQNVNACVKLKVHFTQKVSGHRSETEDTY